MLKYYYVDIPEYGPTVSGKPVCGIVIAEIKPQFEKRENYSRVKIKKLLFIHNPRLFDKFDPGEVIYVKTGGIHTEIKLTVKLDVLKQMFETD